MIYKGREQLDILFQRNNSTEEGKTLDSVYIYNTLTDPGVTLG